MSSCTDTSPAAVETADVVFLTAASDDGTVTVTLTASTVDGDSPEPQWRTRRRDSPAEVVDPVTAADLLAGALGPARVVAAQLDALRYLTTARAGQLSVLAGCQDRDLRRLAVLDAAVVDVAAGLGDLLDTHPGIALTVTAGGR